MDAISKGYRVEIRPGSVTLISLKDGTMPNPFPTVAAAYAWVTREPVQRMAERSTGEIIQAMAKRQGAV